MLLKVHVLYAVYLLARVVYNTQTRGQSQQQSSSSVTYKYLAS